MESSTARVSALRDSADRLADPYFGLANTEAEQALLGALLINNQAYEHVVEIVAAADFANGVHGSIYEAIAALVESGRPANAVTLKARFDRDGALRDIGGAQYLAALAQSAVTVINAPHYARTIAELARRRELVLAAQDIIADASDLSDVARSVADVSDAAEQSLTTIGERAARGRLVPMAEVATATIEAIQAAYKAGDDGASQIGTGIADVDRIIGGMLGGDLVVLGARPGMGKSSMAGTVALNEARRGKRIAIFSLEMTAAELMQRWIAGETGIGTERQRLGRIEAGEWGVLIKAQEYLSGLPIMLDDQPRLSVGQIRQRCRRMKRRIGGLDLIIVDHLQLMRQPGRPENRRLEIGDITSSLKAVAKELSIPVLLLSQLGRGVEQRDDKRPVLSDLRESGEIEQDADVVLFLYREHYYRSRERGRHKPGETPEAYANREADLANELTAIAGLAEIIVAKNRHGRDGWAKVAWDGARQRFGDLVR